MDLKNINPRILIIDDELVVRLAIEGALFGQPFDLFFAEDGQKGLELAYEIEPDVILLDVMMPGLNGFEICRQIRASITLSDVPILLISTLSDRQSRIRGLDAGADDFISKPFDRLELKARLASVTRLNRFRRLAEQRAQVEKLNAELLVNYDQTIEGWSKALDLRDKETEGHTRRVTDLALKFARRIGIAEENLPHIWRGAMLHDVGKLGIPDAILLKPGKLNAEEWAVVRKHTSYAYEWLHPIAFLRPALDIPYCHHEKWNGSGYPRGLQGEEIPIAARIFAFIDVWDAITSDRPYHLAMSKDQACQYIRENAGSHFDPNLVEIAMEILEKDSPGESRPK